MNKLLIISQTCPKCKHVSKENRLSQSKFVRLWSKNPPHSWGGVSKIKQTIKI